jgi:hypothetical protein
MAKCTAKVTVTIADQDGVILERFLVVDAVEPDPGGAKAAEVVIGRRVREHVEDWFEIEEVGPAGYSPDYDDAGPRTGR